MYDVIIIGAGPAGMAAGIYAARRKLKTLILSRDCGGQMALSGGVENYMGFSLISGADLAQKFREHLESIKEDLELLEGKEIVNLEKNITVFAAQDKTGALYYGKTAIICSGRTPRHLGVPGEKEFLGKGVSVCAICDGPLYKNKDVAVIGGGNSAMGALYSLSKAARRVYSINLGKELAGDEALKAKVESTPNITFFSQAQSREILGKKSVIGVKIIDAKNQEKLLPVSGVFVEIGWEPNTVFDRLTEKNSKGEIKVDQNMQTSVAGLFAAGDVNDAWGEQIIIACGEGAKAALAAGRYLGQAK
ncbi:MAG: FAD-dependent oxidoreductase [Patescibacteria group bacterium]|nr:FAD-dependent oxidoreductase [Patescibacteria group bacterium]